MKRRLGWRGKQKVALAAGKSLRVHRDRAENGAEDVKMATQLDLRADLGADLRADLQADLQALPRKSVENHRHPEQDPDLRADLRAPPRKSAQNHRHPEQDPQRQKVYLRKPRLRVRRWILKREGSYESQNPSRDATGASRWSSSPEEPNTDPLTKRSIENRVVKIHVAGAAVTGWPEEKKKTSACEISD